MSQVDPGGREVFLGRFAELRPCFLQHTVTSVGDAGFVQGRRRRPVNPGGRGRESGDFHLYLADCIAVQGLVEGAHRLGFIGQQETGIHVRHADGLISLPVGCHGVELGFAAQIVVAPLLGADAPSLDESVLDHGDFQGYPRLPVLHEEQIAIVNGRNRLGRVALQGEGHVDMAGDSDEGGFNAEGLEQGSEQDGEVVAVPAAIGQGLVRELEVVDGLLVAGKSHVGA